MTTAVDEYDDEFTTGSEEIKKEAAAHRPVFTDRAITPTFLGFTKDNPEAIVRPLDDDKRGPTDRRPNLWLGVWEHSFVKTVEKPDSFTGENWREKNGAMCRRTKPFAAKFGDDCYICDQQLPKAMGKGEFASPSMRIFMRVVLREKFFWKAGDEGLPGEERIGKVRGIRDVMEEVAEVDEEGTPTGKKIMAPAVRVIGASQKTFYQHLVGHAQSRFDDDGEYSVLHADWKIKRTGFGMNDSSYTITMQPGSDMIPAQDFATAEYPYWDVNNPKVLAYYEALIPWSLRKWLLSQASDEHIERWFVPGGWDKWEADREAKRAAEKDEGEKAAETPAAPAETSAAAPAPETPPVTPAPPAAVTPPPAAQFDDDEEAPAGPRGRLAEYRDRMSAGPAPARGRQDSSAQFEDV